MILYHGSPFQFDKFDLSGAGEGTGIKFCMGNVGFNGYFYTFPYFMAFMLKKYLKVKTK